MATYICNFAIGDRVTASLSDGTTVSGEVMTAGFLPQNVCRIGVKADDDGVVVVDERDCILEPQVPKLILPN
jgi:hypothetical protein